VSAGLGSQWPPTSGPLFSLIMAGEERDEERNAIVAKPPDILFTNYAMLEFILTRVSPNVSTHYTGCGSVEGAV
jgi:hypothetical protein